MVSFTVRLLRLLRLLVVQRLWDIPKVGGGQKSHGCLGETWEETNGRFILAIGLSSNTWLSVFISFKSWISGCHWCSTKQHMVSIRGHFDIGDGHTVLLANKIGSGSIRVLCFLWDAALLVISGRGQIGEARSERRPTG